MNDELTEEEKSFLDYLRRPATLSKKKIEILIDDLEEVISNLRLKIRNSSSRLEKNLYYTQIENRQSQIKYWSNLL